jgi:hypothetical protein
MGWVVDSIHSIAWQATSTPWDGMPFGDMASRHANFQSHDPAHARSITKPEKGYTCPFSLGKLRIGWFRRAVLLPIHDPSMARKRRGKCCKTRAYIRSLHLHSININLHKHMHVRLAPLLLLMIQMGAGITLSPILSDGFSFITESAPCSYLKSPSVSAWPQEKHTQLCAPTLPSSPPLHFIQDQGTVLIPGSVLDPLALSVQRLVGPSDRPLKFTVGASLWFSGKECTIMHLFIYPDSSFRMDTVCETTNDEHPTIPCAKTNKFRCEIFTQPIRPPH